MISTRRDSLRKAPIQLPLQQQQHHQQRQQQQQSRYQRSQSQDVSLRQNLALLERQLVDCNEEASFPEEPNGIYAPFSPSSNHIQ